LVGDALFTERRPLSITATIPQHIAGAAGGGGQRADAERT
jgi:hypothetical protein